MKFLLSFANSMKRAIALSGFVIALSGGLGCAGASAETRIPTDDLLYLQFELPNPRLLQPNAIPAGSAIATSYHISQTGLTLPSLWWVQQQFGGKLLTLWIAYDGSDGTPPRVEYVVNEQVWSLYTYVERYTFVNQFGGAAREFGYNARIFNPQGDLLAIYVCDFSAGRTSSHCGVFLRNISQIGFQQF
ncbi:MAG TPA: hypothetical protein IGS37_00060 [Synechococcales cyanobacterium M55_K2018_004]|nr:hypothetical protein [Synechococcales cyanobacterium M55_K2018_004]